MKAVLHTKYGPPDELQVKEIEKPVPADNELLITQKKTMWKAVTPMISFLTRWVKLHFHTAKDR